jgi:hypothetical protein
MIGDQRHTEALEREKVRLFTLVGERCCSIEAGAEAAVELQQVRMQT